MKESTRVKYTVTMLGEEGTPGTFLIRRNTEVTVRDGAGRTRHKEGYDKSTREDVLELTPVQAAGLAREIIEALGYVVEELSPDV